MLLRQTALQALQLGTEEDGVYHYKGWLKREDGAGSLCTVFWFHYEDKHLELKGII